MKALILLVTLALAGCSWTPGYGRVLFTDPYSGEFMYRGDIL